MNIINKIKLEYVFLVIFIGVFMTLSTANPWGGVVQHDFPYSYLAGDAFLHQSDADYRKESDQLMYGPPGWSGNYDDVYGKNPVLLKAVSVAWSHSSGLEVYDTIFLITTISYLLCILVIYLIIKEYNKSVAVLSLPITILGLRMPFIQSIWWGQWHFMMGFTGFCASLWFFHKLKYKGVFIILPITMFAAMLGHAPEFVFFVGFCFFYFAIDLIFHGKIDRKKIKLFLISLAILLIFAIDYLVQFWTLWGKIQPYTFKLLGNPDWSGMRPVYFSNLGIYGYIFLVGILLIVLISISKKKAEYPALVALYCLILSNLRHINLMKRGDAFRWVWYVTLSFFFGLVIYKIVKMAKPLLVSKKWKYGYSVGIAIILLFVLFPGVDKQTKVGAGSMNQYDWDAILWVRENTPRHSLILSLYGDTISSSSGPFLNMFRPGSIIMAKEVIPQIQEGKLKMRHPYNYKGLGDTLCKMGFLSYGFYGANGEYPRPKDMRSNCEKEFFYAAGVESDTFICDFNFVYINKITSQQAFTNYNMYIANRLMQNDWFEAVYDTNWVSILKNNKPGEDCIEEQIK